jgi:hypothetical protein
LIAADEGKKRGGDRGQCPAEQEQEAYQDEDEKMKVGDNRRERNTEGISSSNASTR